MMNSRICFAASLSVLLMGACGDKQSTAAVPLPPATTTQSQPSMPKLAMADASVPLERYQPLTNDQALYLAASLSTAPVIYDQLAVHESVEYARTSDSFKRQELMNVLKPQIDGKLAEVKQNGRYVYVDLPPGKISLGHYNLEKKAFPVNGMVAANMRLSNMEKFEWLSLPEGQAREVEAALSKGIAFKINEHESELGVPGRFPTVSRLYVFAQGPGPDGRGVTYQITKIVMMDTEGKILTKM